MDDLLNSSELDSIISKIDLDSFKEEVKLKNETRGRKPRVIINHWRESLSDVSYSELNGWVDDVLTGAGRLSTGNSRVSGEMIFALLKGLPSITTPEIKSFVNRKRVVSGDFINDESYCQWLCRAVISAMKSLDYYTEKGKKIMNPLDSYDSDSFDAKADMIGYLADKDTRKPITTDQLLNNLLLAGLDIHEATNYINGRPISA